MLGARSRDLQGEVQDWSFGVRWLYRNCRLSRS
jgi:hypothetical protein